MNTLGSYGQTPAEKETIRNKQRINYIYNISNYVTWDKFKKTESFTIGVLGEFEESLITEFVLKAKQTKIKNLPVSIKYFKSLNEITATQILYVHERHGYDINKILEKAYVNNTLLISENYPFRVSMINFIELGNDFHFEIKLNVQAC